jgi:hypothetical protein
LARLHHSNGALSIASSSLRSRWPATGADRRRQTAFASKVLAGLNPANNDQKVGIDIVRKAIRRHTFDGLSGMSSRILGPPPSYMRISLPFDDGALGRLLVSRIVTGNDRAWGLADTG